MEDKQLFKEKGQVNEAVNSIITLIVGVGVAVLVLIFVGVLGGQTSQLVESDIEAIGNNAVLGESFIAANGTTILLAHKTIQTAR